MSLNDRLMALLKTDRRFVDDDGELVLAAVESAAWRSDVALVRLLLADAELHAEFVLDVDGYGMFNADRFVTYIREKSFLDNSYTRFRNRIGLTIGGKFLSERGEVALAWPYKDCVLEGGQTKEEESRKELFFNEVLARDEINRLLDPKALTGWRRYTANGDEPVTDLARDENGVLRENLIIKGNNLLALHSLLEQFRGKVKLIYIDPPYNMGGDSFGYNNSFNHSAWLTFMRNRLKAARELLRQDGAIFVQIDLHEVGYLTVLLDEVFGAENKVQIIAMKTASPAGFKTVNPGPIDVTEYVLFYTKDRRSFAFRRSYVATDYDGNYNLYIDNPDDEASEWRLVPLRDVVYREHGIAVGKSPHESVANARAVWGKHWKLIRQQALAKVALEHAERVVSVRDPHKPSSRLREALARSRSEPNRVLVYDKSSSAESDDVDEAPRTYLYNGGALSFYSNKVMTLDGVRTPTVLLTDFWDDVSWDGIAKEGGVKLKNGKKPEQLLKRIIEMTAPEHDIVLDFFLGSGTTAAVAHKMGRQYIGVEQLDYGENDSVVRLQNVIRGDRSGISKAVNWLGGGDFVYCELMPYAEAFMERIQAAQTSDALLELWGEMAEGGGSFLKWYVNAKAPEQAMDDFVALGTEPGGLDKQKHLLAALLDKNQLYVNLSEIGDERYGVSDEDKRLNRAFYGGQP